MPAQSQTVYKNRDAIIADLVTSLQARFPDAVITPDTVWYAWIATWSGTVEGLFLAWQLLHDDMFIQTASGVALIRYGEMFGRSIKGGTVASGTLLVSGAGGTAVPVGTQVAAPQSAAEALTFSVSVGGTIPNPGTPTAPTLADAGAGALPAGTYEYGVTFQTLEGETAIGVVSAPITIAINHNITLSAIPLGGPGTIARNLYRRINAGAWTKITHATLVAALNNNTTVTLTDSYTTLGGTPPVESTAERLSVAAASDDVGEAYNVGPNTIIDFASTLPGLTTVTNLAAFAGGSDEEDIEEYRSKLEEWVRAPKSGSPADLKAWAESVPGVETATVIEGDNLGVATAGHNTIRISGPGGTIPSVDVQNAVQTELDAHDLAGMVVHVGTFTADPTNVTVTITLAAGYSLTDVDASVRAAITSYITNLPVAGTVYKEGIASVVFGLPGVATLVVNTPAADVTVAANHKATPGTITVN